MSNLPLVGRVEVEEFDVWRRKIYLSAAPDGTVFFVTCTSRLLAYWKPVRG